MILKQQLNMHTYRILVMAALLLFGLLPAWSQVTISGNIQREDGAVLKNVPVSLTGVVDTIIFTDVDGNYSVSVPSGNYTLTPTSDVDPQNGVTTLDMVLIQRHFEGIMQLDSPYKLLAADADQSEQIDTFDIVDISEIVYGIEQRFANNNSWRFVAADYVFPDPTNPWSAAIPESANFLNLTTDAVQNFIAVKIGDVNYTANTQLADDPCTFGCGLLTGRVVQDGSADCMIDSGEEGLSGWIVKASSSTQTFYGNSRHNGEYSIQLPPGTYTISLHNSYLDLWHVCEDDISIIIDTDTNYTQDFALQAVVDCPLLEVNMATPFLRRCFTGFYYISYCNKGTITATDAYVEVELDEYLSLLESSIPWTSVDGNTYTFPIEDLAVGECAYFNLYLDVSCESVLGQTLCSEATIFPNELCGEPDANWDGATLDIDTECEGDSVRFFLRNLGEDMEQPAEFIIIEDDMIMMLESNDVQLDAGDVATFAFPANGSTWRMEAAQTPNHPFTTRVSKAREGCDTDGDGEFSLGFVTQFPQYANRPWNTELCAENIGSFDPNDKRAWPVGAKEAHYIEPATPLEYQIRFQNTGTDTAFLVVIQDTLSSWVDPATINVQSVSHQPFEWKVTEEGILSFIFPDIMLPDSNVNEPASHGFVKFRIEQAAEVPLGAEITNEAAIYFDFNEPVITNEVFHTVAVDFLDVINYVASPDAPVHSLLVAPNPIRSSANIRLEGLQLQQGVAVLYDLHYRPVRREAFQGNTLTFDRGNLSAGVYLLEVWDKGQRLGLARVVVQ